ncbi:diphosphoinositol-polyphosphate diphosphatase [Malassezia brasiliensis]|uniref:Diphosphoinositol-polyphosphate diphosphatase n=1 Tax=Malassezia brasiliensis TaxID=1821822 RepID=A0AAF0DV57_9BASI|nr:diphosphoinositol-polyphosphate diphosphatase [Malassezia brasiliensis]
MGGPVPRAVAIAVAVQHAGHADARVCLVSSRKHKDAYVLPKGGVERGETPREAAARELWEEADAPGATAPAPYTFPDTKPHKHSPTDDVHDERFVPSTVYSVHAFGVAPSDVADAWPESHERTRVFVPREEARARVAWRRGMAEALAHTAWPPAAPM